MNRVRVAVVRFLDSAMNHEQDDRPCRVMEMVAVGFVVAEDDDGITLSAELVQGGDYRRQLAVPKVAIVERAEMRPPRKGRGKRKKNGG